mmetsp:Transcript_40545/g.129211  ORF Transcript_40545/g.129211 Transcript_40545/m.129211 type:complete len:106 (+) Transcript_40545:256-573(+)
MQAAGAGGAKAEACSRLREEKAQAAQAEYRRQNERRRGYMLLLMIVPILLMVLVWHLEGGGDVATVSNPHRGIPPSNNSVLVDHWSRVVPAEGDIKSGRMHRRIP